MNAYIVVVCAYLAAANAGVLPAATSILPTPVLSSHIVPVSPLARVLVPGLEGQYVPDNLEKLYDDGSYKPEAVVRTVETEGQYVPDAEGKYLPGDEGVYVHDNTEKLFDDGSYKRPLVAPLITAPISTVGAYAAVPSFAPVVRVASPFAPVVGVVPEGHYIHDFTEKLYDDGSYKPQIYV